VAFLSICVSDTYFESTATLIRAEDSSASRLSASVALGGLAQSFYGSGMPSMTPELDFYASILRSRRVARAVVRKHDLVAHYDVERLDEAVDHLFRHASITISKEGVVGVNVEATEPQLASDVANTFVSELENVLHAFKTSDAGLQLRFITSQLDRTKRELEEAEDELRRFKEENKIVSIEEQAKGSAGAILGLRAEVASLEARLEVWRNDLAASNPELRQLRSLVEQKRRQLDELQHGSSVAVARRDPASEDARQEIYVPISNLPLLGLEFSRLSRKVRLKETVYGILVTELEQSRIAQARKVPEVQSLDEAVPALRKSRPRTSLNMLFTGVGSLFLSILLALALDLFGRLKPQFVLERTRLDSSDVDHARVAAPDEERSDRSGDSTTLHGQPAKPHRARSKRRKRSRVG